MRKQKEHSYFDGVNNHSNSSFKNKNKNYNKLFLLVNRLLLFLIVVFSVAYILSINDLSIKGFVLNDLKSKAKELAKENADIELKVVNLGSNETINNRAQQMAMVKVDTIDYITMIDGRMAKR